MESARNTIMHKIGPLLLGLSILFIPAGPVLALDELPRFSLSSAVDGKQVSSEDFKGKTLLIIFFTTWCPPCRQEIPTLIELQKEYAASGFTVVGLSMDEQGPNPVIRLMEKEGINYPDVFSGEQGGQDCQAVSRICSPFNAGKRSQGDFVGRSSDGNTVGINFQGFS
jgi:thiol-disulfide isomerase/thioredoxin